MITFKTSPCVRKVSRQESCVVIQSKYFKVFWLHLQCDHFLLFIKTTIALKMNSCKQSSESERRSHLHLLKQTGLSPLCALLTHQPSHHYAEWLYRNYHFWKGGEKKREKRLAVHIYIKWWKCILDSDKAIQRNSMRLFFLSFFPCRLKVGHWIIAKYFTNNCLLNASNLDCHAGSCEEKKQLVKKKKKMCQKIKIFGCDDAPFQRYGVKGTSERTSLQTLVLVKCLSTHSPLFSTAFKAVAGTLYLSALPLDRSAKAKGQELMCHTLTASLSRFSNETPGLCPCGHPWICAPITAHTLQSKTISLSRAGDVRLITVAARQRLKLHPDGPRSI